MRSTTFIWATLVGMMPILPASAGSVACEKAFKDLKQLERLQRHQQKLDIDRLLINGAPPRPCSKERVQFEDDYAARAKEMALVAKAFIGACGRAGEHMADLELYSNNNVLQPPPSSGRKDCGIAENRGPSSLKWPAP